ncbi:MAG: enoyl-CoA hydratase/isomerase family protein [Rhodospirillales bacterium]|nr:enoyl-CoA hydratase/isomerase family protein [Rhodospirillales bacterium]MCB9995331.1 enoyl-CoA hydratase/isomerase family protein [Rhodospirillales bacterium]
MTEQEIVLLDIKDAVATVTLNRPDRHNAFDDVMIARLSALWDELAARDDVGVVVLKGNGKSFSAGADLNWMKRAADYSWEQNHEDALKLAHMLRKLYELPQLMVACVFGAAMGGGMGLVSCCDIVIADKDAKFALSEVKLGLIPATIAPYVLRAMGERHARRYFQTGERFDGETAYKIGFVHELAERPEDVEYILHKILQDVSKNGPKAMRAAKALCLDFGGRDLSEDILKDSANRIAEIRSGDEAKEGLSAFLDKRAAHWAKKG